MKQTKLFKTLFLLTMLLAGPKLQAQEPYAVLSEDNTTLTFYYDDLKESRNSMDVGPFTYNYNNGINSGWYAQRESITTVVFDDSFADCTSITSTAYWFYYCKNLTTITGIGNLHTDNVTDMRFMFCGCNHLTSLDVTNFNTQNVTTMYCMFSGCSNLTSLDVTNFDTQKVTNMSKMFYGCSSLTSLDVTNFNTQNVTNMYAMFYVCRSLTSLDVTNFDTKNVTDMASMFKKCYRLTSLDMTNFNTQNVTDMSDMFSNCSSLTSLDMTNFNTQNVIYMVGMFSGCSSLTSLDVTNFNTQNVTYMSSMYSGCSSLTNLGLTNINTQKVTNMSYMFSDCSSLTNLDLTSFNIQNVTDMSYMFYNCGSLTSLDLTNFNTQNVTNMYNMFNGCRNLALVTMGENMSIVKSGAFNYCPKLTDVYCLAVTVPNADNDAFDKDYIEANTTLHVPAESISDYQTTVPWSYFKNIEALRETKTDLVDGEVYDNEFVANNVDASYTRTFNNTNWQALYVPFSMSYDDWKDDFDVAEINNFHEYDDNEDGKVDRTVLEILYVKEGSTLPNTPYLIRAKETGTKVISLVNTTLYAAEENSIDCSSVRTKYTFTGTYTGVSGEEMYDNGYYALAGGTLSQPSSANVSLGSFRWYLKPESRTGNYAAPRKISVRVIGEADGETTNIADATVNDRQEEYYNLEGVRINKAEATGIYIVRYADGRMKKVIKK
jgi:surface protein